MLVKHQCDHKFKGTRFLSVQVRSGDAISLPEIALSMFEMSGVRIF